jgi:hypothetical protein
METVHGIGSEAGLLGVVRGVRSRWRLKRALRGAAITVAGSFVVYVAVAFALHAANYSDVAVLIARIACLAVLIAMTVRFVILPLRPKVRDEQVALYLEEHEPTLEGALFTAVEVDNAARSGVAPRSVGLAQRLTDTALDRARTVDGGRRVDAESLQRGWATLAAVLVAATMFTALGPSPLRNSLRLIAMPWDHRDPATRFSIAVDPGNMTIAKGGDALVGARLRGFDAEQVVVLMKAMDSASWIRVPMTADSSGHYTARLLDIAQATEYSIEANGVKSTTYRIDVTNLPYVKRLDMEYRYPSYTGLSPEKFDSTGDIAALKGTMVLLKVHPTMATTGGRVVIDNGEEVKLLPGKDGSLTAMLRVDHTGFYKIELAGPDGRMVTGSLDYTIDMLPDRPPTVQFTKPGRDSRVHSVDEVYTEAVAKDDYGVAKLDLVYSINGADERTIPLSEATSRILKEISAGHTFMLEDYQLKAGDVVSYYARATDNDAVSGAKSASTDIYFLNVAPYSRDYRQGQPQQGGGGGGGQQGGQFSQRERDIIAATFKSSRDSAATDKKTLGENVQTIRLSQQKLREEVEALAQRLIDRGVAASDTNYAKIAKILPKAGAMMDTAEKTIGAGKITAARGPEQRALAELQHAEAVFRDITVQQGGGGGGGGGGASQNAQDLADLFELNQEKLRNQYEQVQRGQQQQQQQQAQKTVDSLAEKMRELAQRQQSEDERARAKADSMNQGQKQQGGDGQQQRQNAQQAEDAARQLERLAREQQSQSLADAARSLQQAANEMRKSAASQQNGQGGQNGSSMSPAAQKALDEARRLMDQERNAGQQRSVDDALQQARQLQADQQKQSADAARMNSADSAGARQSMAQRSGQMADKLKDLTQQMDRIAQNNRQEQPATSHAVKSAADSVRSSRLENQMRAAKQMAAGNAPASYLRDVTEPQIGKGIDNLNKQLEQAQQAEAAAQNQQKGAQSLDKARDVVSGLQSLEERIQQQADRQNERRLASGAPQNGQQQNGQQQNSQQQNGKQQSGKQQSGQQQGGQQQSGQQQSGQQQNGQQQNGQQQNGQQQSGQQGQGQQGQGQQGQGQQGQQGQGQQGQGQGQGQGQRQAGGQPSQSQGQPGGQVSNGGPNNPGGGLDPQFQRELAQRLNDAEALRRDLVRQGRDVSQLDQAIKGLRALTGEPSLSDPRAASTLHAEVEALKSFEFQLTRAVVGEKEGVRVGRVGDVPPTYRQWVEQYYREIGKTPPAKLTSKPPTE